ncbi:MAG: helix-turn-helix domain-containing protein [Bacillota bacterium]
MISFDRVIEMEKAAFSPEEAAIYLGVHPQTVYKLLRTGELPGRKVGQLWRIPKETLMRYLERGSQDELGRQETGRQEVRANRDIGQPVTPELWQLAGLFSGGPEDLAERHDKYIAEALEREGRH